MTNESCKGPSTVNNDTEALIQALRGMPTPAPRPGFVDRVLANAARIASSAVTEPRPPQSRYERLHHVATRWETWFGAALGGAAAAALTLFLLKPVAPDHSGGRGITLALNETRDIDVLIESERDLADATIRIAVTGGVALDGFENEHEIDWRTNLERGSNLLSLPVVARSAGGGRLVAVIEHDGKTRRVTINLTVSDVEASRT